MRRLAFLSLLCSVSAAFTVLPYIQIDFAHYFRLAQCQAKCIEKYGSISKRTLNNGAVEDYFNTTASEVKYCELGCEQHRRGKKNQRSVQRTAIEDGLKFWKESSAESAKVGSSPVASVQLMCQRSTVNEGDFEESVEGYVGISLRRSAGPVRYIVQWKQRTFALGFYDESQWITASIEANTFFKVDGMVPGVQYRFMVTVVGAQGRLGNPSVSDWTEIESVHSTVKMPSGPITVKSGFNTEHGVTALFKWNQSPMDSCMYRITLANSSHVSTRDLEMDVSGAFLLTHLEFDSSYSLQLSALATRPGEANHPRLSQQLAVDFKSLSCNEIYGKGSLNCAPLPVEDFRVVLHGNGSAMLHWTPSSDIDNVLTYQIQYQSLTMDDKCETEPTNIYLNAASTSAEISVRGAHSCEYIIRLINYDLIGREAYTETRVLYAPLAGFLVDWQILLIVGSGFAIVLLCCILKCTISSKCKSKVIEKQGKLVEYA